MLVKEEEKINIARQTHTHTHTHKQTVKQMTVVSRSAQRQRMVSLAEKISRQPRANVFSDRPCPHLKCCKVFRALVTNNVVQSLNR